MEKISHNFKKKFGQNFIRDNNVIDKIVSSVSLTSDDLVIEIGPGAGILTKKLSQYARVLAYEIDNDLEPVLNKTLDFTKVDIIWDDFLKRTVKDDISKYKYKKLYLIANLPYYITTPIIEKIIKEQLDVERMVVMVQKEVGDRFCALPSTKSYGSLTVFLNYYYDIKKLFLVSRNVFTPQPNVDSVVMAFDKKEQLKVNNLDNFFKLVRDSFKFKRKTLKNNLIGYDLGKVSDTLIKYNLDLSVRAEEIPIELFVEIANNL